MLCGSNKSRSQPTKATPSATTTASKLRETLKKGEIKEKMPEPEVREEELLEKPEREMEKPKADINDAPVVEDVKDDEDDDYEDDDDDDDDADAQGN